MLESIMSWLYRSLCLLSSKSAYKPADTSAPDTTVDFRFLNVKLSNRNMCACTTGLLKFYVRTYFSMTLLVNSNIVVYAFMFVEA